MGTINAQGTTLLVDDSTPGTPDVEVGQIKSYSGFDGEASEVDKTHLKSAAKEFGLGLQDFGSFSSEWNTDYDDSGQNVVRAAVASRATKTFALQFENGKVATFQAVIKNADRISGAVDAFVEGGMSAKIDGAVTIT